MNTKEKNPPSLSETTAGQREKLERLISRLEEHQENSGLSDVRFVTRFKRYLGSTKSWRQRLCARNWEELSNLAQWETKLSGLLNELEGSSDLPQFVEKLPIALYARVMFERLQGQSSDRRCGVLVATYGCGKSWALRYLNRENMGACVLLEADASWKNSFSTIVRGLARALNVDEGRSTAATWEGVLAHLKMNPVCLLVDEAHEAGVELLKLLKTIVNQSRATVLLATHPSGWDRLTKSSQESYQEARQLVGRTLRPIHLIWANGVHPRDVSAYLSAFGVEKPEPLARKIAPLLRERENLRLLADALEDAESLEPDAIEAALARLCG